MSDIFDRCAAYAKQDDYHVTAALLAEAARVGKALMTWTPVTERLPDDEQTVLIALLDCEVWTGFIDDERWHYVSGDPVGTDVTHWMDFPEAPK